MSTVGTTHTANQSALSPAVIDSPDSAAAPATVRRTPIQAPTRFPRLSELSMRSTFFVVANCDPALRLSKSATARLNRETVNRERCARHGTKVGPVGAHPSVVAERVHYSNAGWLSSG